ncbi:hypothetical protein Poli38472_013269 [Pythium oligandrum]|uniref:Vesicle tethering protein Uso1/P115-like head domain-containing protein n=1 Tax=Pythium oligandrum TaxID=41045 RepID=A0A8K1FE02_PYTOL|nr:hypothetical protein Poli38472_013269 [Pythium oligandrum]|eukprot:TMW55378.1 hypothetical protein Poli38472_013269 [Pythium oligandrum]
MQRVISRVHAIVTTHTGGDDSARSNGVENAAAPSSGRAGTPSNGRVTPPTASPHDAPSNAVSTQTTQEIRLAVERLQYATLLGERKKAVAALLALATSFTTAPTSPDATTTSTIKKPLRRQGGPEHEALGLAAIPVVLSALVSDPRDTELMEAMLELLQALVATSPTTATALLAPPPSAGPTTSSSLRSASMAMSTAMSGMQICLQLLQDPSPWIRGPTIALVKSLQQASQKEFASSVLECKEGLRRLLEVVEDKREHIRDAALQVLVKLTEREKNVQQFLAFEDGFVRLFQIMEAEGLHDGSSVVSDCLQIVNNMVRDNLMTQKLFQDLPFLVTHLPQLLSLPSGVSMEDSNGPPSGLKSTQKKRTLKLSLQLLRFLAAGLHEGVAESRLDELAIRERAMKEAEIPQIQSFIARQSELMGGIAEIACCQHEELTDLQLQALDLLELLCTGNGGNQIILVSLHTKPSRRSFLSELIRLDIGEDETPVGAAATNVLDSLFLNNEAAKMAIFQNLNAPPPMDDEDDSMPMPLTAGRVLLDAMIQNAEAVTNGKSYAAMRTSTILMWKACHRFSSLISDSEFCKELALRIPAQYDTPDAQAVAGDLLLTRCLHIVASTLTKAKDSPSAPLLFQANVGMLTLMIKWCLGCTKAVHEVVSSVSNITLLMDTMVFLSDGETATGFSRDEIVQLRGLFALLLGSCIEFLIDKKKLDDSAVGIPLPPGAMHPKPDAVVAPMQLTRQQLLDMISKRVGLDKFTSAFIQFQQSPSFVSCVRASRNQGSRLLLAPRAYYQEDDNTAEYLFPLYEKVFTNLYRELADKIQKRVISIYTCTEDESDGTTPSVGAVSAYQDLIRIQDREIHELKTQVKELQARNPTEVGVVSTGSTNTAAFEQEKQALIAKYDAEIAQLKAQSTREKTELEQKLAATTKRASTMETRFEGLTKAFEQLEQELQECRSHNGSASAGQHDNTNGFSTMNGNAADLETERSERRRLENELHAEKQKQSEVEQRLAHDAHEWEMAKLQMQQEMEDLRVRVEDTEEQLTESNKMVDTVRAAQELAQRNAEEARAELGQMRASKALESVQDPPKSQSDESSKNEAAAKEMYELWEKERAHARELKSQVDGLERTNAELKTRISELEAMVSSLESKATESDIYSADAETLRKELAQVIEAKEAVESTLREEHNAKLRTQEEEARRLQVSMSEQTAEIERLRSRLDEMKAASAPATFNVNEEKDQTIQELSSRVTELEASVKEQRRKYKTTVTELENEIARMFLDKKEIHRKSKASMKELENEIARMFLEKVEMEKQLNQQNGGEATDGLPPTHHNGGEQTAKQGDDLFATLMASVKTTDVKDTVASTDYGFDLGNGYDEEQPSEFDDVFMLLASLEIQCDVFRERLEATAGTEAVETALTMSRQRGAFA